MELEGVQAASIVLSLRFSGWDTLRVARLASGGNSNDIDFRNEAPDDESKDDGESDDGTEADDVQCATDAMLNT
jgi:hypothetical protein